MNHRTQRIVSAVQATIFQASARIGKEKEEADGLERAEQLQHTQTHKILEERRTMQKTIGRETYPVALDQLAVCQRDVVAAAAGRWRRKPPLPDPSPLWSLDLLSQISIGTWPFGIGRQNRADGAQGERQHGDRQLSAQSCKLLGMEIFLKKKEKEEETKERRVSGLVSSTTGTKLSVERQ